MFHTFAALAACYLIGALIASIVAGTILPLVVAFVARCILWTVFEELGSW